MFILLLIWILIGIAFAYLVAQRRPGSVGLPFAYFLGLSLIHVPGALLHVEGDDVSSTAILTRIGFEQTIIGMTAFLAGVIIVRYRFRPSPLDDASFKAFAPLKRLVLIYLSVGSVSYFGLLPIVGGIGTITSVVASLGSLIIVGACLMAWIASKTQKRFWFGVVLLPLMPLATVLQAGFLGYGTYWALAVVAFLFAQSKRRVGYVLFAPVVLFIGLSVFVNYMAARGEIRQLVERASIGDRLQQVSDVFQHFEWLDLSNSRHREAIDSRLNQNWLVGVAVERLESGYVEYAYGSTVGKLALALIPRVIWPDKPQVGGGGTIVRDFTGLTFGETTSVGAGQVFEFYINFGIWGVIGGFLLYGFLLGQMDLLAIKYLRQDDQRRFLFWFLIGLALLQPGGNLLEVEVSAASSAITAYCIGYFLVRRRDLGSLSHQNYRS